MLYHYGQGSSFSARVEADPKTKSAILIVTNAKVDLTRLKKAAKKIRKYYAAEKNCRMTFTFRRVITQEVWRRKSVDLSNKVQIP